jgi:hypothetical protein
MYKAKQILDPDWFETYTEDRDALARQLVGLNTNLFILEKITKFNFNLFGSVSNTFWVFVTESLVESCIMCAWRIAIDTDSNCLTAAKLKNAILKILPMKTLVALQSELKRVAFEKRLKEASRTIERRDTIVTLTSISRWRAIDVQRLSHRISSRPENGKRYSQ